MTLINLNELSNKAKEELIEFNNKDVVLSENFKYEFSKSVDTIEFSEFTTIIKKSEDLLVILPNQWFYIAIYFVDLLKALQDYKIHYNKIFNKTDKTIIKDLRESKTKHVPIETRLRINDHFNDDKDSEFFIRFLTSYEWWHGKKTIDRSDFVSSPILNLAGVVNDSHSYIVEIVKIYEQNPTLIEYLKESSLSESQQLSFKNVKQSEFKISKYSDSLEKSNLKFSKKLITRFISSLCTKPFVLLSGLSGSGKTRLVQSFAQWICESKEQYCIVPVGADWTNREPLLGYPNALDSTNYVKPENGVLDLLLKAKAYPTKPFFLILDEMNLSHVERYFADFLSAMESDDDIPLHSSEEAISGVPSKIRLPKNLFVVGTVNIDETTYMFSPKVLDRANAIEFRLDTEEIEAYLKTPKKIVLKNLKGMGTDMAEGFIELSKNEFENKPNQELNEVLIPFFNELKKSGAEFGYRTAGEIHRLFNQLGSINSDLKPDEKIDIAIMQKLLPKLHGSQRKLKPVLNTLGSFCLVDGVKAQEDIFDSKVGIDFKTDERIKFRLSLEKITRMYKGSIENGFASYAEA